MSKWIPITSQVATDEEREEYGLNKDVKYFLDCPLPDDGDEILVCKGNMVWQDVAGFDDDGPYLDGSWDDWCELDAWMPMPQSYSTEQDTAKASRTAIVVKIHSSGLASLDTGTAFVCESFQDATTLLKKEWQEYLEEEKANGSDLNESACFCDEDSARVVWSDGQYTEYRIINDIR